MKNLDFRKLHLWQRTFVALGIGLIVNVGLAAVLHPLAPDLMQLSAVPVAFWTILGTLGATIVFAFMRRNPENLKRRFMLVAIIVLFISFIPDIAIYFVSIPGFTGATIGGLLALMLLHVTTALITVSLLLNSTSLQSQ